MYTKECLSRVTKDVLDTVAEHLRIFEHMKDDLPYPKLLNISTGGIDAVSNISYTTETAYQPGNTRHTEALYTSSVSVFIVGLGVDNKEASVLLDTLRAIQTGDNDVNLEWLSFSYTPLDKSHRFQAHTDHYAS